MTLRCAYITRNEARAFVRLHHRHHAPPQGAILHLGCWSGEALVGVAILGRPVSRVEQTRGGWEVTRVATDGTPHVCSKLYGFARRVVQVLDPGARLITYTLDSEPGTSLRAAGWIEEGRVKGRDWARCARRDDQVRLLDRGPLAPTDDKRRWRG